MDVRGRMASLSAYPVMSFIFSFVAKAHDLDGDIDLDLELWRSGFGLGW